MSNMSMNIVVLDGYAANPGDISWEGFEKLGRLTVYERTSPEDIVSRCLDADAVLTNKCHITKQIIEQLPKLKYIGELATGYNNIDVEAAAERGVAVSNVPAYSTDCVAQLVFAFILEAAVHVGEHSRAVLGGQWQNCKDFCFWNYPLTEIGSKRLGIIGNGRIGKRVGEIASAFGMKVSAYSPSKNSPDELSEIISQSDIISLNCPLKPNNIRMIDVETIARMKQGVWLINTARGALIDEDAVSEALASGKIGYYCADVMSTEPIRPDNPLLKAPNVILTPHIGWAPYEARVRLMNIAVDNLKAFLRSERLNRVDG